MVENRKEGEKKGVGEKKSERKEEEERQENVGSSPTSWEGPVMCWSSPTFFIIIIILQYFINYQQLLE